MKVALKIVLFYTFLSIFMIIPLFHNLTFDQFSGLLYLNYDVFPSLQLEKFNIQFMIMFVLLFYILYFQQISILNENVSFLSMAFYREKKKETINRLLLMQFKSILKLYLYNCICFLLFCSLIVEDPALIEILKVFIYLFKYSCIIFVVVIAFQIISLLKTHSFEIVISFFMFILTMVTDVLFDLHLITYSNDINYEISALLTVIIFGGIILLSCSLIFKKGRELNYD